MTFNLTAALNKAKGTEDQKEEEVKPQEPKAEPSTKEITRFKIPTASIMNLGGPTKLSLEPIKEMPALKKIEGLELVADLGQPRDLKSELLEMPSLDELAEEFQNSDQPELFDDAALNAVHKACLKLESSIENADEVREQLTYIMNEISRYPDVAAKISDSDIAVMVKSLRQNYNVVAFAKATNKKAKAEKQSKIKELVAEADAYGLFDGLDI